MQGGLQLPNIVYQPYLKALIKGNDYKLMKAPCDWDHAIWCLNKYWQYYMYIYSLYMLWVMVSTYIKWKRIIITIIINKESICYYLLKVVK